MRHGRFPFVALVTALLATALMPGCSSPSGPSQAIPDFPNSTGSWWTYEVSTTEIVGSDTTRFRDTITARITATTLLTDGMTAASVWKFDPYFIDVDESRPESLLICSQGLDTRSVGDTIRIYRDASTSSLRHTLHLKKQEPQPEIAFLEWHADCSLSRVNGWQSVTVPAGQFHTAYLAGTFCGGPYYVLGADRSGEFFQHRTLFFEPHVGFVQISQSRWDSNLGETSHTWSLLSYNIAAPSVGPLY